MLYVAHLGSRLRCLPAFALSCLALLLSLSGAAFAKDNSSYTEFGHDINVGPGQHVGDVTCFGCNIHVRGQVAGDVTAFGGNIVLEDQTEIAGDVTAFGGDVRLDPPVKIAGDLTVFAGKVRRDPQATVSGDVTEIGGRGWLLPMLLVPFMILGLIVAFVIWLIQRLRSPSVPAAAA